jgi:hypothetical protein
MVQELHAAGSASAEARYYKLQQVTPVLDQRIQTAIDNTVYTCECSGRCNQTTLEKHRKRLVNLSAKVDLFNSHEVSRYILNLKRQPNPTYKHKKTSDKPLTKKYLKNQIDTYAVFCTSNQIPFDKPKIHYEKTPQIIPTTEQVTKIIAASSSKYSTIFTIMAEIGVEGAELRKTPRENIDTEQGILNIIGVKQHNNGIYKLKTKTAQLLRNYLAKQTSQTRYPFPKPKALGETWRRARTEAATKFSETTLQNIPLKNLRNHAGAIFYKTTGKKDPIATMRFMRHKRIDQTLHYLQTINLDEPEEYITRAIQLGTPTTMKDIIELSNAGYTKLTEADGYQYFRILKALAPQEEPNNNPLL